MKPAATVLLLFVFLVEESIAGYSTGFRSTPKPKHPEASVNPVIYPSRDHSKEHRHWKEFPDSSVEIGKDNERGSVKIEDRETDKADKEGVHQEEKILVDTKVVGPSTGSGHWVPAQSGLPIEGQKVPYDIPYIEEKKVPYDIPSIEEKKVYDVPSAEEEKIPHDVPSTEEKIVPYDVPSTEEKKIPNVPSTEEKNIPHNVPEIPGKEEIPVKLDDKSIIEEHHPYSPDENPSKDVSVGIKGNPNIPDTVYKGSDFSENLPQPHHDIPKTIVDEKIPIIPYVDSPDKPPGTHSDKPLKEDTSIHVVPGGTLDGGPEFVGPDVNIQSNIESDDKSDVDVGPQPFPDISSKDETPGAKTELLEPYPMKVGGGNINLNLYELMEKLELSRFLHLVEEANLKDMLTGEGPLTIFAPSDYALSKLDAATIRRLATNQELLRQYVLYHCVDGQIYGPSLEERDNSVLVTKFDRAIHINIYGEGWFVNGIPITTRDQTCKNGVIHVLDESLYPFPTGDLMETLDNLENFKIYTELIRNAKLDKELKGDVVYTIFAPTDVAFSKLPPANLEWLKWDIPAIKRMFRQLTVSGMYYTTWIPNSNGQIVSIDEVTTLSLSGYPDSINVNGAELIQYDITAGNGCIHTIDDIWFLSELGTPSSSSNQKKAH